jgi:hypothetical protein
MLAPDMPKPNAALFARLAAVADSQGRKSGLRWWLERHRPEFAAAIQGKQPNWNALAKALATAMPELRDGRGRPPSGARLRKTWWTVTRAPAARRPAPPTQPQPKPIIREEPNATRPTSAGGKFHHDPRVREGEAEALLGDLARPKPGRK